MNTYHMTRKERQIHDLQTQKEILKNGKFTTLGLCRNNEPYVVTLSYGYDETDHALYFHAANKGLKLDFIRENQEVCGTIIEDLGYLKDECAHAYRSLVYRGKISILKNLKEKKEAMEVLFHHLEEDPDPIRDRTLKNDAAYNRVTMIKIEIQQISGKEGYD